VAAPASGAVSRRQNFALQFFEVCVLHATIIATSDRSVTTGAGEDIQIVRLHYFEDHSFTDIARELKISKAWTSRLHARAMAHLAKRMLRTV